MAAAHLLSGGSLRPPRRGSNAAGNVGKDGYVEPYLEVTPLRQYLGEAGEGDLLKARVHLTNLGKAPLTVSAIHSLSESLTVSTAAPLTLAEGQSAALELSLKVGPSPTHDASKQGGLIEILSNDPQQPVVHAGVWADCPPFAVLSPPRIQWERVAGKARRLALRCRCPAAAPPRSRGSRLRLWMRQTGCVSSPDKQQDRGELSRDSRSCTRTRFPRWRDHATRARRRTRDEAAGHLQRRARVDAVALDCLSGGWRNYGRQRFSSTAATDSR